MAVRKASAGHNADDRAIEAVQAYALIQIAQELNEIKHILDTRISQVEFLVDEKRLKFPNFDSSEGTE